MEDPKTLESRKLTPERMIRGMVTANLTAQPMWRTAPMKQHLQQLKTGLQTAVRRMPEARER